MKPLTSRPISDRRPLFRNFYLQAFPFWENRVKFADLAGMAKLVDAPGLGPDAVKGVSVRVRFPAPKHNC